MDKTNSKLTNELKHDTLSTIQKIPFINQQKPTPLHKAVDKCDEKLVSYLLNKGINVNVNIMFWGTALHVAVKKNNSEIISQLINYGANINERQLLTGWAPLHVAVQYDNKMAAELLIDKGADVNATCTSESGLDFTPLHIAAEKGSEKMVELLLNKMADVNALSQVDGTPLFKAAYTGNTKIIKLLLAYGAEIDYIVTKSQYISQTALHAAILSRNPEAVRLLLRCGINISPVNFANESILHVAIYSRNKKIIQDLLESSIDINFVNSDNKTILDYYIFDHSIIEQIKQHIVKLNAANFFVSKKNLMAVENKEFDCFKKKCCEEIEIMRSYKIATTNLTFYKILHGRSHELSLYIKHLNANIILDCGFESMFPLYAGMIDFLKKTESTSSEAGENIASVKDKDNFIHYTMHSC
ncbi:serine/threonine-protein phosphatase 6 regulatory ankyrin repeat subunit B-like [Microplitis mediator]|uniref:serine/threonine-protein phosphatase 6 regulatory ankyrin repeat subunit B-like n=1 Tax=Microplitis mediator TaxID=375433 RepID=UPI00255498E4|nr:serine/threonine-protein phosphatase 6 regulatory ankyrin repeat subunit B-like [Microplitis mediator]